MLLHKTGQEKTNILVPPIYSVVRAIKHLVYSKAIGTLIIPRWVSAPYWPFNFKKHMKYQNYVTDVLEFAECDRSPDIVYELTKGICDSPILS
jgi:hypothetical protein